VPLLRTDWGGSERQFGEWCGVMWCGTNPRARALFGASIATLHKTADIIES
jgi:hypothetical protein